MTSAKDGYHWRNCYMSSKTNPDCRFEYPEEFLLAKRKFIIVREAFATLMNSHVPQNYQVGDITLHASFCWETPSRYCCLVNSQNMKKKCFEVLGEPQSFEIEFRTIDGARIYPESYLFDYCLKWQ
jgi:hypothetical protein